jgi:hypothetical protein
MALQIMKALLGSKNAKKGFIFLRLPEVQLEITNCELKKRQNKFTAKGEKY